MKKIIILFSFFIFSACICTKPPSSKQPHFRSSLKHLQTLAKNKYAAPVEFRFNTDSTFAVCVEKSPNRELNGLDFFIYDVTGGKIVYEGTSKAHAIKWLSSYIVQIERIPGMVSNNPESKNVSYLFYDVRKNLFEKQNTQHP